MGLGVTFVSGPRRSGKSAVIRTMVDRLWAHRPHYIRLVRKGGDKFPPTKGASSPRKWGIASARWIDYDADHVFEVLPDALTAIHRVDRFGSVAVEADADAALRYAYPYDYRVFVMPTPTRLDVVFRDPVRAATEFERILDDTHAFASEMFGLDAGTTMDEPQPPEQRDMLTRSQMKAFLCSPLGDELATRVQLQQPYHGLLESDVVIVNTAASQATDETEECVRRIGRLLRRTRGRGDRAFFVCDPCDCACRESRRLFEALRPMCAGGK